MFAKILIATLAVAAAQDVCVSDKAVLKGVQQHECVASHEGYAWNVVAGACVCEKCATCGNISEEHACGAQTNKCEWSESKCVTSKVITKVTTTVKVTTTTEVEVVTPAPTPAPVPVFRGSAVEECTECYVAKTQDVCVECDEQLVANEQFIVFFEPIVVTFSVCETCFVGCYNPFHRFYVAMDRSIIRSAAVLQYYVCGVQKTEVNCDTSLGFAHFAKQSSFAGCGEGFTRYVFAHRHHHRHHHVRAGFKFGFAAGFSANFGAASISAGVSAHASGSFVGICNSAMRAL